MVRFPRQDSPSSRVIITANPHVAEAILGRIKSKVADFEAKAPKPKEPMSPKDQVRERHEKAEQMASQRHSPAISEIDSRIGGPSRPTISVGRSASQTVSPAPAFPQIAADKCMQDIHGKGKAPVVRPSAEIKPWDHEEEIGREYHYEPVPRSTKSSRRRHRKRKMDSARRVAES